MKVRRERRKMKTAKFRYKCRLCGEIYSGPCTSEENAFLILVAITLGQKIPLTIGNQPRMTEIHPGCKVGHGIADLIGTITVEE